MSARLASGVVVSALLRRVNNAGGIGLVLARGDPQAGAMLIIMLEKGRNIRLYERGFGPDGKRALVSAGPQEIEDERQIGEYWQRRRDRDPDLWVIELDVPFGERFAAETILDD